ncbi:MAG: hypothetical protein Q9183_000428 [Haloplaca sp. 2 TL-2023]
MATSPSYRPLFTLIDQYTPFLNAGYARVCRQRLQPVPFVNGSLTESTDNGLMLGSYGGSPIEQSRNGYRFRGSDPESDEEDANPTERRQRSQNLDGNNQRTDGVKYAKAPMSMPVDSPQDSVDGYDSFENTNNKKKRKIPTSGSLGSHHSSLSADMAHMGISSARDYDMSQSELDGGIGHYYGTGSSAIPAGVTGTAVTGSGRPRHGKAATRISGERSPLGVMTNGSNALQAGRQLLQKQDFASAGQQSNKGSASRASDQGIISAAIANAASLQSTASQGKENKSLLEQHASKKPASAKTQFTFTCGSDSAKTMAWQEQPPVNTINPAYGMMPPSNPPPAQKAQSSRDFATQGTQTSPKMAPGQSQDVPPQGPVNPEMQQPLRKPRRSLAKQLAYSARQRRMQQAYDNQYRPPAPEDTWICEFCEYEMIYGSPPEALIRQYEIKDRHERRRLAEKRRLLEKAKMKGRKGKKGNKNAAKSGHAANPPSQGTTKQRYDQQPDDMPQQNEGTQSDDYLGDDYQDESISPMQAPPPRTPTRIPQPTSHAQHQSIRSANGSAINSGGMSTVRAC